MEAPILETTIDDLGLPLSFPTCSYLEDALCGKAMGDAAPVDSDGMPAFLMPMALPRVPGTTNPPLTSFPPAATDATITGPCTLKELRGGM